MSWNYAELSKMAKIAGGPEELVESILKSGIAKGKHGMKPWLFATFAAGSVATLAVMKLVAYFKMKKNHDNDDIENIKAELIKGIKDYDEAQAKLNKDNDEGGIDNENF